MGKKSRLKREKRVLATRKKIDDGYVYDITPDTAEVIQGQIQMFESFFGRKPEGDEPIFFDTDFPDKPTPINIDKVKTKMTELMKQVKLPEEFIYAFEKTGGLLVSEDNKHLISKDDLKMWDDAVDEYRRQFQKLGN